LAVVDSSKKISLRAEVPSPHPSPTALHFTYTPPHPLPAEELPAPRLQPKSACQLNYSFNQIRPSVFEVLEVEDGPNAACATHPISARYGKSKEIISNIDAHTKTVGL
jgi:hypothetical protein